MAGVEWKNRDKMGIEDGILLRRLIWGWIASRGSGSDAPKGGVLYK
jgi:hypothetical protein